MRFLFFVMVFFINMSLAQEQTSPNIANEWPNSRYIEHGDGTVTDLVTGLMWQKCSLGQEWSVIGCSGDSSGVDWQSALLLASENTAFGYGDWRLPNIKELASLLAIDRANPAINSEVFPNTYSDAYWTNTPYVIGRGSAWVVSFDYGDDGSSDYSVINHVRLVRSEQ